MKPRNFRWETRDGRKIGLYQMHQSHLENVLVYIDKQLIKLRRNRYGKKRRKHFETWVRRINRELSRRARK